MVDMKALMYSNFSKKTNSKKNEIFKIHKEWKISPSQVYRQGSKNKRGNSQRAFLKPPYSYCPPFWADVVNSCWLAPALARPAQTSPNFFIFP
jgi:hypothetical protein